MEQRASYQTGGDEQRAAGVLERGQVVSELTRTGANLADEEAPQATAARLVGEFVTVKQQIVELCRREHWLARVLLPVIGEKPHDYENDV